MALGIADRVWTIGDLLILGLLLQRWSRAASRGAVTCLRAA